MSELSDKVAALEEQLEGRQVALAARFEQLAALTRELDNDREQLRVLEQELEGLRTALAEQQAREAKAAAASGEVMQGDGEAASGPLQHAQMVRDSDLFDGEWYLATYPDVQGDAQFSQAPHEHYLLFGGSEGRRPCPEFDSAYYLSQYPDVAEAGFNPLVHYLLHGRNEGRRFHPSFEGDA